MHLVILSLLVAASDPSVLDPLRLLSNAADPPAVTRRADPRIWLEPCAGHLDKSPFRFHELIARMIVEPPFTAEWAVSVVRAEDARCVVISTTGDGNVLQANPTEDRHEFPCDLADEVGDVFEAMLGRTRMPEPLDPQYADGTRYTAIRSDRCGRAHVPPSESPAAALAELGERLLALSRATKGEREAALADVRRASAAVRERLRASVGESAPN